MRRTLASEPRRTPRPAAWTSPPIRPKLLAVASDSRLFRLVVGALGSTLCLMPLVALAHPVGLIGLPPRGHALVGDLVLLVLGFAGVAGAVRDYVRAGRRGDSDRGEEPGGGDDGGDDGDWGAHEFPLISDAG